MALSVRAINELLRDLIGRLKIGMTSKVMVAVGVAWFAIVVVWLRFFDQDFTITWLAQSPVKRAATIAAFYLLISMYLVFLAGWLIPLGIGIYRLVRHQ